MKERKTARFIKVKQHGNQWYQHQHIGTYLERFNLLPDAAKVRKEKKKAAPVSLLQMVF